MVIKSAAQVLESLPPRLVKILATLDGAPQAVAEATVQLLPFGSRAGLETTGCAVPGEFLDDLGHRSLRLTPLAYEVMAAAAARVEGNRDVMREWEARAQRARLNGRATSH